MSTDIIHATAPNADSRFIRAVVERIRDGGCVLLLGPGVAVDPRSADRTPITTLLARELASDPALQGRCPPEMEGNLRYVAQLYYEAKRDRVDLGMAIQDFYKGLRGTTTAFHRNLAHLPFRLCINTSPDDFMLEAFRATGTKHPVAAHYNFHKAAPDPAVREATESKPLVYYLYGHSEDLTSLVLTESDLIEFLVHVVRGDPALSAYIRRLLADKDSTLLFVGFGFQNWYLRVLLHVLEISSHTSRAVALEDTGFFAHPDRPQTIGYFSGERSIEFRSMDWDTFAEQLCAAYRATVASAPVKQAAEVGLDAPKAFLCYASEDREAVETLGEALEGRGVAIWRDKQNLRAGEKWDRALVDVIRKHVDYVVVAQSSRMADRAEGYFRKEIEVALDRLSKFDQTKFIFVVAVTLSAGSPLPELEHLHAIDVSTDAGIATLAKTILNDWTKPNRRPAAASNSA